MGKTGGMMWPCWVTDVAATEGHLPVLRWRWEIEQSEPDWWRSNIKYDFVWYDVEQYAALKGYLHILDWLFERNIFHEQVIIIYAIRRKQLLVFDWVKARASREGWDALVKDKIVRSTARHSDDLRVLTWAHENGVLSDEKMRALVASGRGTECMRRFLDGDRPSSAKRTVSHDCLAV